MQISLQNVEFTNKQIDEALETPDMENSTNQLYPNNTLN